MRRRETAATIAPKLQCGRAARLARPGDVPEASLSANWGGDELEVA